MAIVQWILIAIAALVAGGIGAGQFGLLKGSAPTDLGVRDGRLKAPSATPNSVSSQAALYPDHPQRGYASIAALALNGDGPATLAKIKAIVQATAGAEVVKSEPGYLYAQYTTALMKYVDDVEFWFDPVNGAVQVRSASRIGKGDLGANRKRVEMVRAALAASG